jgi:hypothetical protein
MTVSVITVINSVLSAHAVSQTECMAMKIKRWITIGSTMIIIAGSLFGLPLKYYSQHVNDLCYNENKLPKVWTPYTSKLYAVSYMKMWFPEWNRGEHKALMKLWGKESGWNHEADNPKSSAYGIAQVLKTKIGTPAPQQVARGLEYIVHRYDKPSVAWSHWRKNGWY